MEGLPCVPCGWRFAVGVWHVTLDGRPKSFHREGRQVRQGKSSIRGPLLKHGPMFMPRRVHSACVAIDFQFLFLPCVLGVLGG